MNRVLAPRRRRNRNFDFNSKRRAEIVRHAVHVGAMDTEDRDRWLVAYALHNPGAKDQAWSVLQTAQRMGGQITEAEAEAIADEADQIPYAWKADRLGKYLGLTYPQRTILGITTIGACDFPKRRRTEQRKHKDKVRKQQMRRARGMRPQSESLSATQPWKESGMSRRTWYRQNKPRTGTDGTTLSAAYFLSTEDKPVPPEGAAGESERGFAPKKKKARGLPSSQTATTMAADRYATLPVELRFLALGLVGENFGRAGGAEAA